MCSDAQQGEFLPFENLRAVSLSNRGLTNFGSGLITKRYGKKRAATLGVDVMEGGDHLP